MDRQAMQDPSRLAQALGHEHRLHILAALAHGPSTVADLADRLGLPQPRVSTHLSVLRTAGLITVEMAGRQRIYRLAGDHVRTAVIALGLRQEAFQGSRPPSREAAREVRRNSPLRQARTCYDHLAGVVGVWALEEMLRRGWLTVDRPGARPSYRLAPPGNEALSDLGVDVPWAASARRRFAFGCPDWTERRYHLGGALGAALLRRLRDLDLVQCSAEGRTVEVRGSLRTWLS